MELISALDRQNSAGTKRAHTKIELQKEADKKLRLDALQHELRTLVAEEVSNKSMGYGV